MMQNEIKQARQDARHYQQMAEHKDHKITLQEANLRAAQETQAQVQRASEEEKRTLCASQQAKAREDKERIKKLEATLKQEIEKRMTVENRAFELEAHLG